MVDFDQLYAAVKRRAYAVWTDCKPANGGGGILEGEHHSMIPWDREVLPFGALVIEPGLGVPLTMDALVFRQPMDIWYVNHVRGGSSNIRQKLQALITDLWPDPPADIIDLDYGQVEDVIGYSHNDSLYPNYFFRSRNSLIRAGRIQVKLLVG